MGLVPTRWYLMLVMPSTVCLVLVATGLVLLAWRLRRGQPWLRLRGPLLSCALGCVTLYLASTPLVATMVSRSLERMTPGLQPDAAPTVDAIVVPGGGQSAHVGADGVTRLQGGRGANRLETAITAFKAGKAPLLAVGGGSFGIPGDAQVGAYMKAQAVARGVPEQAVVACGEAKYTTDEGAAIAELLKPHGVRSILLCTSATHLPRARITYERLGFDVTGLPCDFDTRGEAESFSPSMLLPRGQALFQTENGLKEWLGLTAAWLQRSR